MDNENGKSIETRVASGSHTLNWNSLHSEGPSPLNAHGDTCPPDPGLTEEQADTTL